MWASTLSQPPLMSRNSDGTLKARGCKVRTVSVRAVHASNEESEGREPHWLPWRRPMYLAMAEMREATILSRILDMV